MNKTNLLRAAQYISELDQDRLVLYRYRANGDLYSISCEKGDVVGHCTILDPNNLIRLQPSGNIDFKEWGMKFFDLTEDEYVYLFTSVWAALDPTVEGAVARLRHVAQFGLPDTWQEELNEEVPISYRSVEFKPKLLPCPLCGEPVRAYIQESLDGTVKWLKINHGPQTPCGISLLETVKDGVRKWNNRPVKYFYE